MFLDVTGFDCGGQGVLNVIKFVMLLIDILLWVIPILLIVMISIDFVKNVIASDDGQMKKNLQLVIKRILMCVALFLVDPIVHFSINLLGENGIDYAKCVNIALTEDLSQYSLDYLIDDYGDPPSVDLGGSSGMQIVPGNNSSNGSSSEAVDGNIFIGDSRFVGMKSAIENDSSKVEWICEVGKGYDWLENVVSSSLSNKIKDGKKYNVIINLGVNDMGNVDQYLRFYNNMVKDSKYSNCNIIVVSVNPIDDEDIRGYSVRDSDVKKFNSKLKDGLGSGIKYCDTYSKIKSSFKTIDGLHYTNDTYKKVYQEIQNCL